MIIKMNLTKTFRSESINRDIINLFYIEKLQHVPINHGKLCFEQMMGGG